MYYHQENNDIQNYYFHRKSFFNYVILLLNVKLYQI